MTFIQFCKKDIPSSPIGSWKKVDAVLLEVCKVIETIFEKGFEDSLVDQSFVIDDHKVFFKENLEFKNEDKSDEDDWLTKT